MAYTVKKGDNLGKIAKANNMTLAQLLDLNPEYKDNPNMVSIGAKINVAAGDTAGDAGGGAAETTEKFDLLNVPGEPSVWKVDKTSYLVYQVPGSAPPVYIRWEFTSAEDLQAKFGPDVSIEYNKVM